ncbi:MAG: GAF domain-containing protein [Nitrospirae bacterium]|nr:GAF domain-containing protein [Nitrospirota bacterium]
MQDKGHQHKHPPTELLTKVARIANSTLELRDILDKITQVTAEILEKEVCSIYLVNPEKRCICANAATGLRQDAIGRDCLSFGEWIIGWVAQELQPLAVEDVSKEPRFKDIPPIAAKEFLSILAVPIIWEDKAVGVITLQTREPYSYSQDEANILIVISHNISSAIRNSELYKRSKARLEELKTLHEVGKAITSILSMDTLLPYICEEVSKLLHVKGCILRLFDDGELKIKASHGLAEGLKYAMSLKLGEGIAGYVAQTGEPLMVDNVAKMPPKLYVPVIEATSVLCVPLKIGEQVIGTLGLYDKANSTGITQFTQDDLEILLTFASASAIAIENARLYTSELEKEGKILSLYWEVIQTRDYLESIIDNSADAIIASDTDGLITSWNKGAEKIYGYTEEEVLGKFLPMVPEFLHNEERKTIEKIKRKDTIKHLETLRQAKDGKIIEVSLTLSPILDSAGNVTGISGISRDITERKAIEKDLIRKNQELSRLFLINSFVRSTLDLDRLLRMVLTVVTMGNGLGFNRALLFLVDESKDILKGVMGVGPASYEEAGKVWISLEGKGIEDLMEQIEKGSFKMDTYLDTVSRNINISLREDSILSQCIKDKRPINVTDIKKEPFAEPLLIQQLGTEAFGVAPLIAKDKAIGLIWVDNFFTRKAIGDEDLQFLMGFTAQVAGAIENARLFEEVSLAQSELQNVFESISDMLYFTDKDFNIRHVNEAVLTKIGKPEEEIIGKKCYEVFHGKDEPWKECPHYKTLETAKPHIEEVTDPFMGGTFVISVSPIFDSAKNLIGTVHISRDITELQALREKVSATERMAALGEMAARVAHEIRNPLVAVGGFARRLEKKLAGEQRGYANIIVNEVQRLEEILRDVLGFVRAATIVKQNININTLIDEIITLTTPEIIGKGNTIAKDLSGIPLMVTVDPYRIKEAILNLITNANQSTEGGIVTVKTWQEGNDAVIGVSDTGCGIKKEDLKNIFNPFFTTRPHGTGLGLAITHRIIQEHKGRISVESKCKEAQGREEGATSQEQGGTTFKIYLPIGESHQ